MVIAAIERTAGFTEQPRYFIAMITCEQSDVHLRELLRAKSFGKLCDSCMHALTKQRAPLHTSSFLRRVIVTTSSPVRNSTRAFIVNAARNAVASRQPASKGMQMQPRKSSLRAMLRGGVAALTALPFLVQSTLAGVTSFHGEKVIKSEGAPPSQVLLHSVKTPKGRNDDNTTSPIKHVIIIVGENRSFDHLYGTYVSPSGDSVQNLLSEGIVNADGTPGPNFSKAAQMQASDTTTFSVSPATSGSYSSLPPPNLAFTPVTTSYAGAPWVNTTVAGQYDYGLLKKDLPAATEGASGLPQRTIDTRISNVNSLPSGPFLLSPGVGSGDYADSPVHRFSDVPAA
jgi:hypothetical protein